MRSIKTKESSSSYVERLAADGWRTLGRGFFSVVMSKRYMPNVMRINSGKSYDSGWETFTQHLKNSRAKHNPHFARYGTVKKFGYCPEGGNRITGRYMVGEVERLYALPQCDYFNASMLVDRMIDQVEGQCSDPSRKLKCVPYIPKTLYEAVEFLVEVKHKMGSEIRYDIHDSNVMSRKNGDLVITDPFSYDVYDSYSYES